ncbi:MAG: hypothetical protein NVSMB18_15650 [Acetobacteraceae bacterium]
MDRREKLLSGLDLAGSKGLEIGPLDHPLVLKSDGDIRYVDYADAAFLRHKYRDDSNVVAANIPETDAIWGENTIGQALGGAGPFDYAIASHVVEHVPDLIAWLAELHAVLKPGATLRLAVPDRRFTFDFMRRDSAVSEAIAAHVMGARAPTPGQLIDSCLNHHRVTPRDMWDGGAARQPRYSRVERLEHAVTCARAVMASGVYIDVHCWVFTPLSFAELMEQLAALGYLGYECGRLFPTERDEDEFVVILHASADRDRCRESWRAAAESLLVERPPDPAGLAAAIERTTEAIHAATRRHDDAVARLERRFAELERRTAPLVWLARRAWARVRG